MEKELRVEIIGEIDTSLIPSEVGFCVGMATYRAFQRFLQQPGSRELLEKQKALMAQRDSA